MRIIFTLCFATLFLQLSSQNLYFPPLTGGQWDTLSPASLGWCEDKIQPLYDFLDDENTKAFIVLKDGKIVLEKYFDAFTKDSLWYWASAGKSLTATLVGIAQQEGLLDINDTTSDYLGTGWTACPPDKESLITVRNQLTMTTGLDDSVPDPFCTLDTCLLYLSDAGTRWAYHNGPYTLLDEVIKSASGMTLNGFFNQKLRNKIGMDGLFFPIDYNNVLLSTPRSMARFGLLMLNEGWWGTTPVLSDATYFQQMVNTSQNLNLSYGYLWWLNGKATYMVPGSQFVFPGLLCPDAPADMFAAMGKNGQFIDVVPSQHLVLIRMGDAPDGSLVPYFLNNQIWQRLNEVICDATPTFEHNNSLNIRLFPNPASAFVNVEAPQGASLQLFDQLGRPQAIIFENGSFSVGHLPKGMYVVRVVAEGKWGMQKLVVE